MRLAVLFAIAVVCQGQPNDIRAAAVNQWRDYRLGLFVHWGVATGRALPQSHSHARKSVFNPSGSVPAEEYDKYFEEFNPTRYDPDAWLKLAHEAGMRYAVFVAKHHDGFSMSGSDANPYNITRTPYGKDVAAEFAAACRRQGLGLGWQISPKDWKHPDFGTSNHDRYNAYYEKVVEELATRYGPLAVMWFDGIEPIGPEQWKQTPASVAAMLHRTNPGIMLSNHSGAPEDFLSFEAMVGPFDRVQPWEATEQINPSGWVFNRPMPTRPFRELLRNLVYTISRDGNYLLDVGPMQDGRLYGPDAERLREFGAFMRVNAAAVHGTRGGPYRDGDWGGATCKGRMVYLFLSDRVGEEFVLKPLAAKVRTARRLDGGPLQFSAGKASWSLRLPGRGTAPRPVFSVVQLELDREAFDVPVLDALPNLAATALVTPSSTREGWATENMFDNLGDTAWDPAGDELISWLQLDLRQVRAIGSVSFSQRSQRQSWHQYFKYRVEVRASESQPWRTVYQRHSCLGGVPVLELDVVRARYLRVEFTKPRKGVPVQLAEFRVSGPLISRR